MIKLRRQTTKWVWASWSNNLKDFERMPEISRDFGNIDTIACLFMMSTIEDPPM